MIQLRRRWVGVPFREHGRDRTGVDCWGLTLEAARVQGVQLPDYEYVFGDHALTIAQNMHKHVVVVDVEQLAPGDVIGFDTRGDGRLWHLAPYLGDGEYLNVTRGASVVVGRLEQQPWRRMIVGCYRLKGARS